ncbi:hypothetical protein LCGC14_1889470 [marine sediment metagenome]|uniref:Uncharacterized protein n=1 Tax=marine sediment metagenome TaxID=412755 RepID=A0A0F9G040_9ZZZZ
MPVKAVPALNSNHEIIERAATAEQLAIAIDNNAFSAVLADVENIVIDNRNMASLLIHLFNNAGTNSFDYEISGHAKQVDVPPALSIAPKDWVVLPNGTGSVANDANAALTVTDDWAWIAIRLKRTVSSNNSIADIFIRGLKN